MTMSFLSLHAVDTPLQNNFCSAARAHNEKPKHRRLHSCILSPFLLLHPFFFLRNPLPSEDLQGHLSQGALHNNGSLQFPGLQRLQLLREPASNSNNKKENCPFFFTETALILHLIFQAILSF